mgnify:CR=1 FL=1
MVLPRLKDGILVITQEEARLLRTNVKLFDMDALHVPVAEPVIFERNVIPVFHDGVPVGSGHLFFSQNIVWATIVLDYQTPERLNLQIGIPVYAKPQGTYYLRGSDLKMDYVDVQSIELYDSPIEESFPLHIV